MKNLSRMMVAFLWVGYLVATPFRWQWRLAKRSLRGQTGKRSSLPGLGLEVSVFGGFGLLMIGNLVLTIGG